MKLFIAIRVDKILSVEYKRAPKTILLRITLILAIHRSSRRLKAQQYLALTVIISNLRIAIVGLLCWVVLESEELIFGIVRSSNELQTAMYWVLWCCKLFVLVIIIHELYEYHRHLRYIAKFRSSSYEPTPSWVYQQVSVLLNLNEAEMVRAFTRKFK